MQVELWKGITLDNTLDAYAAMPLRNQLARGSAWGFFVVGVPRTVDGAGAGPRRWGKVSLKFNKLNPMTQSTPTLHVNKEEVSNVEAGLHRFRLPMAADVELWGQFLRAIDAAAFSPPGASATSRRKK